MNALPQTACPAPVHFEWHTLDSATVTVRGVRFVELFRGRSGWWFACGDHGISAFGRDRAQKATLEALGYRVFIGGEDAMLRRMGLGTRAVHR